MRAVILVLAFWAAPPDVVDRSDFRHLEFYVPENPRYTVVDSAVDSLRFTLEKTLRRDARGHLASISSFVDPEGQVMGWHDFGHLEGPGWAANAVGGAHEIYRFGRFLGREDWMKKALSVLDHVLEGGFIDHESGVIRGYRDTVKDEICLNYKHNSDWFCPGSMAKVAFQLLVFADELSGDPRAERMRRAARRCAEWLRLRLEPVPNGWFPRRVTPSGKVYRKTPEGGNDRFWQTSADGLFIIQLQAALTRRGLGDYRAAMTEKIDVFRRAGGIFGSINHDTYDPHENVAYSIAFRTLLLAAGVLQDEGVREFAYRCLDGLERFKMHKDRNGVATKGLLYMERSWNTSYLWENAEAALAYLEAAGDTLPRNSRLAREYTLDALTILRAAAKHHHGPHGFLTEGVDWDNIVSQEHHIGGRFYGAIRYTEPFLNNQHIAEPTLVFLEKFAVRTDSATASEWRDTEGNVIFLRPRTGKNGASK
ncbi:MAG: hypothetical protein O7J95_10180 [Planctomycetota bacterium]|nr:hypothetical protein [Planctomycetota bacterium]